MMSKGAEMGKIPAISERTILAIENVITGNQIRKNGKPIAPYRSGPEIIHFFNEFGFNDVYSGGSGTPSRSAMAGGRIRDLQKDTRLIKVIEEALHPDHFDDTDFDLELAKDYLARVLKDEGLNLVMVGHRYRIRFLTGQTVAMERTFEDSSEVTHEFISEQIVKCENKLQDGDYPGAITNARSLIEAVLQHLERKLDSSPQKYDGDLGKLYKRVRALMNLDPKGGATQSLTLILSGLSNVVDGLSTMRNSMSDAHPRSYRPEKHHAKLAVNAANTVADFLFDTFEYQVLRGGLKPIQLEDNSDQF
jgi:hypothetical protein